MEKPNERMVMGTSTGGALRVITLKIAKNASEWRDEVFARDDFLCEIPNCPNKLIEAHHIVYRSHLSPHALWIVENGIALCKKHHAECHATHNAILPRYRLRQAVDAVNCVENVKVPHFTKGRK